MTPCNNCTLNFKTEKTRKTGYFQIIWCNVFQWNVAYLFIRRSLFSRINPQWFAWIFLEIFEIQSWKSGKTWKLASFPCWGRKNLADLFLIFPARLKTWPNAFHSYSFIKLSRNEALFSQFYQTVTMETMTITKILASVFAIYFQVLWLHKVSLPLSGREKKLSIIKSFNFFVSDHLNVQCP